MKIKNIRTEIISIPLRTRFATALRTVDSFDNVLVVIETQDGNVGYGAAAPTAVITGETVSSIRGAVAHIAKSLSGMDLVGSEDVFQCLHRCLVGNNSAKAAVDMAIYDIITKSLNIPLYQYLGGSCSAVLKTDITISIDTPAAMATKAVERAAEGFSHLKLKVGTTVSKDLERIRAVRQAVGATIQLSIDANQGWSAKEAVLVVQAIEQEGLGVTLIEQPVSAADCMGLRFVRERTSLPIYADESVFSAQDALRLVSMGAIDGINIKLMKCGGIYNALKIAAIAEAAELPCMVGSMMESSISVTAAAHFACSRQIIQSYDLDAPLFCDFNPAVGGIYYDGDSFLLTPHAGLGISSIKDHQ